MKKSKRNEQAVVLAAIAGALEVPRDRLGRLDFLSNDEAQQAREVIRKLAVAYQIPGCVDVMEQCAYIAKAVLRGKKPKR